MKLGGMVLAQLVACSKAKEPAPATGSGSAAAPPSAKEARAAYDAKQWARCAQLYTARAPHAPEVERADALYNAACCLALDGKRDAAFATLDRVAAAGFHADKHLRADTDLAALHADPRWGKIVAAVEANAMAYESSLKEPALRRELLALRDEDQAMRFAYEPGDAAGAERMRAIDAKTTARMKEVIAKHGWPGKSLVGEDAAHAAWLLVQHADADRAFQKQCLALLDQAVKAGEASAIDYAYLYDRVAVGEDRLQRYGTQFKYDQPHPIEDEANVDARRQAIGLNTMAEYRKDMERMYGDLSPPGSGSGSAK